MRKTLPRVLFVCTGNAGRSQIAHALMRSHAGGAVEVESAGVEPWEHLHPMAVKVMAERGVSLAGHHPKSAQSVAAQQFDLVVTIGDPALKRLPHAISTASLWVHWNIADPADADGTPESEAVFKRTADAIAARIPMLDEWLRVVRGRLTPRAKVGLSTGMWSRERFEPAKFLPRIKAAGFDAIELCAYQGVHHFDAKASGGEAVRELKRVADDVGVAVWSIHSLDPGSLGSPDAAERQRQVDELRHCLDLCEQLGAKIVVSHGLIVGRFADDPRETDDYITQSLNTLLPDSLASAASIAFENDTVTTPGRTAADVLRRIEPYPACAYGFVIDPGHANIAGDLGWIARDPSSSARHRLISLHLNDNDGVDDIHLPPTEGTADWAAVQTLLSGYGGCWLYEVQPRAEDPWQVAARTLAYHRRLWPGIGG